MSNLPEDSADTLTGTSPLTGTNPLTGDAQVLNA